MITGIVAVSKDGGIGFNNSMPWPFLLEDMKWFQKKTTNNIVIMGSNTWSSLPKKLLNRINVIVSKQQWYNVDHVYYTPTDAITHLQFLYPEKELFIIGGQQLYDSTINLIDRFYVTEIEETYKCDKFFDMSIINNLFPTCIKHNEIEKMGDSPRYTIKEYTK